MYPENESQRPGKTGKPKKLLEAQRVNYEVMVALVTISQWFWQP